MWVRAVAGLMKSLAATVCVEAPEARRRSTSRSRLVRSIEEPGTGRLNGESASEAKACFDTPERSYLTERSSSF
jgi:hypothetical protein